MSTRCVLQNEIFAFHPKYPIKTRKSASSRQTLSHPLEADFGDGISTRYLHKTGGEKDTKKPRRITSSRFRDIRRRHRLPGRDRPSTFSAKRLNFRVRDENGWVPLAITTGMVGYVMHIHNCIVQSEFAVRSYLCLTV